MLSFSSESIYLPSPLFNLEVITTNKERLSKYASL
ncbi:hypothetical protein NEOC65_001025 [Neochlamydia sp. AcF65]|nr:hypothetical protein [Neochlamydia sp. AcF65]